MVVVTVEQLAALVQGEVHGEGGREIHDARPLSEAGPGHVTFIETRFGPPSEDLPGVCHSRTARTPCPIFAGNGSTDHVADGTQFTFIEVADPLGRLSP